MRRRPACKRRSGNGCSLGRRRLPVAIHRRSPLRRSRSIVAQITRNRPFQVLAGAIVGAAAVLGFLLLWGGNAVQSVSAMEKMAENIRKVRSARWSRIVDLSIPGAKSPKPGQPPYKNRMSFTGYWLASGSRRTESDRFPKWKGPGPQFISISPAGKPSIHIEHSRKTFLRSPPMLRPDYYPTDWQLEALGKFSGKADRDLGVKTIKGKSTHGFQIDNKKIDDADCPGTTEVWIDTESNLPALVRVDEELPNDAVCTVVTSDIQYNLDFGPKLFDTTPPPDYKDETKKPLPLDEQVREIRESLEACAAATGGTYPGNTYELSVVDVFGTWSRRMTKAIPNPQSHNGFNEIGAIWAYNPDPVYNGKTVTARDKDKVLLRWKLDDGRYEVIFGDVRAEAVTAERLRGLEGK